METVPEKMEGMQEQVRSKIATKILKLVTKRIAKKSCEMYRFHIFCKNLDHADKGKIEVSKESSTSSQRSYTLVPGVVSIPLN